MTGQSEHLPGDVQGEPASTSRLICRELLTCGNDRLRKGFGLGGEPSAVIEWTDPETADERSAHTLLVPEAAVERDTLNRGLCCINRGGTESGSLRPRIRRRDRRVC